MLELGDRIRRPHVLFAADAILILAPGVERVAQHGAVAERELMQPERFVRDLEQADPLDVARGPREVLVGERGVQSDRLEDLRTAIRLIGRDAHFGHDLVQAFADRLDVTLGRFLRRHLGHILVQLAQRLEGQVRVDRLRAVPGEQRELMHLACRTRLHDQPGAGAQTLAHQVLMYRRGGEQRRNRHQLRRNLAVGDDQDVIAELDRVLGVRAKARECSLHARGAPRRRITDIELA